MRLLGLLVVCCFLVVGCGGPSASERQHDRASARIKTADSECSPTNFALNDDGQTIIGTGLSLSTDPTTQEASIDAKDLFCVLTQMRTSASLTQRMLQLEDSGSATEKGIRYQWKRSPIGRGATYLTFQATTLD